MDKAIKIIGPGRQYDWVGKAKTFDRESKRIEQGEQCQDAMDRGTVR